MKRFAVLCLLAACASADSGSPDAAVSADGGEIPFANAAGTLYAPDTAPTPIFRGGFQPPVERPSRAGLCGDSRLQGRAISPITSNRRGCGIANPVRVTAVAGVKLTAPVRIGCDAARAFADWTERSAKPAAMATMGSALTSMRPVASYACRTRNSRPGARLSEHAKGNAIDIAGFTFANGQKVTLLKGWRGKGGPYLRRVWKEACGPFGTVLGPNSDRFHQDHFHFDVARHAGGPYCR